MEERSPCSQEGKGVDMAPELEWAAGMDGEVVDHIHLKMGRAPEQEDMHRLGPKRLLEEEEGKTGAGERAEEAVRIWSQQCWRSWA